MTWSQADDLDARIAWVEQYGTLPDAVAGILEAEEVLGSLDAELDQAEASLRDFLSTSSDAVKLEQGQGLLAEIAEIRRERSEER